MTQRGFIVMEIILAGALFVFFSGQALLAILAGLDNNRLGQENSLAVQYSSAGLEALRSLRNQAFSNLAITSETGVTQSGGVWALSGTNNAFSLFFRSLSIENVQRDANGNVVSSGGTTDPFARKVTVTTNWDFSTSRQNSVTFSTYLTDWIRGNGDWTAPNYVATLDFTDSNSGSATANPTSLFYKDNRLYIGRSNSAGREFFIVDVSNPATPTILGQRDLDGTPNAVVVQGNYAYVGSTSNSEELQIIDVSDPATITDTGKLTTVDLTSGNSGNGAANVNDLTLSGNYLLMGRNAGQHFLIFDIGSSPANPGNPIGSLALTGAPNAMATSGNYAFIATNSTTSELQVVNISSKTSPTSAATFDLDSGEASASAQTVTMDENDLLVGRASSAAPEFYVINVATPSAPTLTATVEVGASINHIWYDESLAYGLLATADNSANIKMVNLDGAASPALVGSFDSSNSTQKLTYDFILNRLFVISTNNSSELEILKPT